MVLAKCRAPHHRVIAINRRYDGVRQPHARDRIGDLLRFVTHQRIRQPRLHVAECTGSVHVSPMIMKVACFFDQHSPMLGQPASSQTVDQLVFANDLLVSA